MLSELKQNLEVSADTFVPGWRNLSKNEVIQKYVDTEEQQQKDGYLSAIMCKYWGSINRCYNKVSKTASVQDAYDMVVDGILYALKQKAWLDPKNKLYNDPNGPDKALNVAISSAILVYFQFSNTLKRKAQVTALSMDYLYEEFGDTVFKECHEDFNEGSYLVSKLVKEEFAKQNYAASFIIDGAAYGDTFKFTKEESGMISSEFSKRLLMKHLKHLDTAYLSEFANRYQLNENAVKQAALACSSMSTDRLTTVMKRIFEQIKHSDYIGDLIC